MNSVFVSVDDPGFRWGLGVFETVLVRNDVALFQQWHLENLTVAAAALGLPVPDPDLWKKAPLGDGIWRWFLTPEKQLDSWQPGLESLPESYSLSLSPLAVHSQSWEARYKTLSYLVRHQARKEAKTDEVVLLNENGKLASASMANLFWVTAGRLYTPSLGCGCRNGVLRRWIVKAWTGELVEGEFTADQLDSADEIFITNSRLGIMPLNNYSERILQPGPVSRNLQHEYAEEVKRQAFVET